MANQSFAGRIRRGPQRARPLKMLIHAPPKMGKTHLAAGSPSPFFLDCERGSLEFDVHGADIDGWSVLHEALNYLEWEGHPYETVVLDTLDALERVLCTHIVANDDKASSIADVGGGFGQGWSRVAQEWQGLCSRLDRLSSTRGLNILILAHSKIRRLRDPDSGQEWDAWGLAANEKKTAPMFVGWVDEVLFLTRKVRASKQRQGRGGERILHTRWSPGRIAGSRRNLPAELRIPEDPPGTTAGAWGVLHEAIMGAMGQASEPREPHQEAEAEDPEKKAAPAARGLF